ncbi:Metallo-dependent phosphatase-like protein [Xylariaceae sp. FL0255]|nr:Metallo-dependent phosphatase-like protein [Xylariaceae sp. FL0255]
MVIRLQVVSELHLETPKAYDVFEIKPIAEYLALLGDIGYISHEQEYFDFLRRHLLKFRIVFLVLGNHEPWHSTWDATKGAVRDFEREISQERQSEPSLGEFILLDRDVYHLNCLGSSDNVAILGCTLFSDVPASSMEAVSFGINDFYHTENWTVEDHNAQFEGDLRWLNEQVSFIKGTKLIILTHYSPTLDSRASNARHKDSPISSGFATDLSRQPAWLSDDVKAWVFGHTHYNCDYVDEGTGKRVVANQRGYYFSQSIGFDERKVIEL